MRPERVHNFGTYFITTQTWGRRSLFQADQLAQLLIATFYNYRAQQKYLLHAFLIMPNHLHLIFTPTGITLERAMQLIKGGYSHDVHASGRSIEIWQPGYTDHRIRGAEDEQHLDYVHLNPVRAGLCHTPENFPYSSASGKFDLDPIPQRLKPLALAEGWHG
jgi:putative transposase